MRLLLCSIMGCAALMECGSSHHPASAIQDDGHTGPAEAAIVGIEAVTTTKDGAAQQVRRGNGVIIRCDGFILAPAGLFVKTVTVGGQTEAAGEQRITIVTNPGRPGEKRWASRAPRFTSRDVGYAALKLNDFHSPGAVMMLPTALKPGTPLTVAFSRWDTASRRFLPVERLPVKVRESAADDPDRPPGVVPFQQSAPAAPAGAVVIGDQNAPVGMCTGSGPAGPADFTSTDVLHLATNCVTPKPEAEPADRDMVPVAGGEVTLPPAVMDQQPDLEGSLKVCMPSFRIDRYEVTNEEYLAYWETLPEEKRRVLGFRSNYYPWTWSPWPSAQPFPTEIARFPVLGVPVLGARGFAHWKGKRLPTPYEWYMAAMGPGGRRMAPEWLDRFVTEKKEIWNRITLLHAQQLQARPELQQDGIFLQGPFRLPWIASTSFFLEPSAWSRQTITSTYARFWSAWKDPLYVRQVGSRDYDKGACGMMDALLNAAEMAAPYPGPPGLGNPRYFEIQWQPPKPPTLQDRWAPAQIQAMTDDRPLQPLSRLYRRLVHGPSLEDLILWSNVNEIVQIMTPNAGWSLAYTGETSVSATMMPPDRSPYAKAGRPAGFQLWQEMPRYTRREMGREAPLQGPGQRGAPGAQLYYYLPVGFRCAR